MAKSIFRGTYIVEHRGILSVVTKKAAGSRATGVDVIGIRINNLVLASLSKIAQAWHTNPEMSQNVDLAKQRASRSAFEASAGRITCI